MPSISLDLVVPCYNPASGWAQTIVHNLNELQTLLPAVSLHLIVVNDGSQRGVTPEEVDYLKTHIAQLTYLTYPQNQGKGFALRTGVAQSKSPYCLYTDVDFPYELTSVAKVFHTLAQGTTDIAVGVRDAEYYRHVPAARIRISKALKGLTRHFLRLPIQDTQCGLKGFNARGRQLFLQTEINRYLFDLEFIFMAARQSHLRMVPVEVQLKPNIIFSKMNFTILLREGYSFGKILLGSFSR